MRWGAVEDTSNAKGLGKRCPLKDTMASEERTRARQYGPGKMEMAGSHKLPTSPKIFEF